MPKATDGAMTPDTDTPEGNAAVARLAARLAGLDLDTGTLELVMAALAADVCDQIDRGAA